MIFQEPVPPSRLNAKVPRDLETICLKCLNKHSAWRYATAAALAEGPPSFSALRAHRGASAGLAGAIQ